MGTLYRVNPMSLVDFAKYLRQHGIPCTHESCKAMIEAKVFGDAAIACPIIRETGLGEVQQAYHYIIIPKRMERWFIENADEERETTG